MSDAFRESNTNTYRNIVTFQSGFGVIADEPFNVGSPTTTNSILNTYNPIKPFGGISGYVPYTGTAPLLNIRVPFCISGQGYYIDLTNGFVNSSITNQTIIDIANNNLSTSASLLMVDWGLGQLVVNGGDPSLDWVNYQLMGQGAAVNLDWDKKLLTGGNWFAQGLNISGNSVATGGPYYPLSNPSGFITTGQTGAFLSSASTGVLTGAFYPRAGNPSGFVLSTQTGLFYPNANPSGFITGTISPSVNITTSINWATANTFYVTITGNTTFTFTGQKDGQTIIVAVANTGTNHFTGAWPSGLRWPFQTAPTQTSGSFTDIYTFVDITGTIYGNAVQSY